MNHRIYINRYNVYHLMLRYPSLSSYILRCYTERRLNELFDFIMALETKDNIKGVIV